MIRKNRVVRYAARRFPAESPLFRCLPGSGGHWLVASDVSFPSLDVKGSKVSESG